MSVVRKAGTTDVSVTIRIVDAVDGTAETGVTSATSGIDLKYRREGAAAVSITETNLSALTDAHADGGILHIGAGYYRLDLPDAACASGAIGVLVFGTITGMSVIGEYVQLVAYDPFDAVRLGLTALPNAAADAAGGLPISDAGGLDMDAIGNKVGSLGVTSDGAIDANMIAIAGSTESADRIARSTRAIVLGTCDTGSTTTAIVVKDLSPASAVNDQFNGRIITFDKDTVTAALRGQATDITDFVHATQAFSVTALTTAPAEDDTFTIT